MIKHAKHYLIPHKGNDYKPHLLSPKGFGIVTMVVFALFLGAMVQMKVISSTGWLSAVLPGVLIDSANSSRGSQNLPELKYSEALTRAAQMKADDMAAKGYFAHNSPEGITPWHWFREAGYDFVYAGENLAVNFYDSEPVHQAWMNSPGHRANILNGNFTEIGIATKEGFYEGRPTIFVVQEFGQPLPKFDFETTAQASSGGSSQTTKTPQPSTNTNVAGTNSTPKPSKPVSLKTLTETDLFVAVQAVDEKGEPLALLPITKGANSVEDSSLSGETQGASSYSSWIAGLLTSPERTLTIAYVIIAAIIILVLLATIFVEIKRQHPYHILTGILLLLFIALFFYLSREFIFGSVLIA